MSNEYFTKREIQDMFFDSKEDFLRYKKRWREISGSLKGKDYMFLMNAILCGQDYRKAFPLTTNTTKIKNGQSKISGLRKARKSLIFPMSSKWFILDNFHGILTEKHYWILLALLYDWDIDNYATKYNFTKAVNRVMDSFTINIKNLDSSIKELKANLYDYEVRLRASKISLESLERIKTYNL